MSLPNNWNGEGGAGSHEFQNTHHELDFNSGNLLANQYKMNLLNLNLFIFINYNIIAMADFIVMFPLINLGVIEVSFIL
jgi:hypothetical protein